jgi:Na+-transporting methylmalonyl-CoA/oxaloacetate decarboxylase gamma subunit
MAPVAVELFAAVPLALIPADAPFSEYALFQASGMTVVLLTLGGLWLLVAGMSKVVLAIERSMGTGPKAPAAPQPVPQAPPPQAAPTPEGIDVRTVAAITAAVHVVLGHRARIVSLNPEAGPGQAWSKEGRREIYQSHRVR